MISGFRCTSDYTPMLLGAQLSSKVSVLELSLSSGLAISSGDVKTGTIYMTTLYARAGVGYRIFLKVFIYARAYENYEEKLV